MRVTFALFFIIINSTIAFAQKDIFDSYYKAAQKEGGKLWGVELNAPTIMVDTNRVFYSNQQHKDGGFKMGDGLYTGVIPKTMNVANTVINFNGENFVCVLMPLSDDVKSRNVLLSHETFHYYQDSIGHRTKPYNCSHMGDREARTLLKLEWNALLKAFESHSRKQRIKSIDDALLFRALRHDKYPNYKSDELAFEIQEGLAQYTALKIAYTNRKEYAKAVRDNFNEFFNRKEYMRSFGYLSGVLYGTVLDKTRYNWRRKVNGNTDFGNLLSIASNRTAPEASNANYLLARDNYCFQDIDVFESKLEQIKHRELDSLKNLFCSNVKKLNLDKINISFNPNKVTPINGMGTIYRNVKIVSSNYIVETKGEGCVLISDDWTNVLLSNSDEGVQSQKDKNIIESPLWTITYLNTRTKED